MYPPLKLQAATFDSAGENRSKAKGKIHFRSWSNPTAGPDTFFDIFYFAGHALGAALDMFLARGCKKTQSNFNRNIARTIVMNTAYAGLGTAESSTPFIEDAFASRGCILKIQHFAAFEKHPPLRDILLGLEPHARPEHVFGDLLGLVRPEAVAELENVQRAHRVELAGKLDESPPEPPEGVPHKVKLKFVLARKRFKGCQRRL